MKSLATTIASSCFCALAVTMIVALTACGGGGDPAAVPAAVPAAPPQTWVVATGGSELAEAIQALDFYPGSITIHTGDTVTWSNSTSIPHTVSIPQAGQTPPPGPPNPAQIGGNVFSNSSYISSGFITKGKTYSVRFTAPGTYAYYCVVHPPEMTGHIVVIPAGMPLPMSAAQYAAAASADLATDLQAGVSSIQLFPYTAGGTHLGAGISPGLPGTKPSQSTVMRFLDGTNTNSNITVPVGTTITWTNESNNVPHTVTFPVAGQQPPAGSPDQVPPSGGSTYDGTLLTNSGVIPPGHSYSLTFTATGTFTYYCLFHDGPTGMIGTVTVQ